MTPGRFLLDLWPGIQQYCPDIKFRMIPYENTPENSVEILRNLGQNIDIVAGLFDQNFLETRQCAALELSRESAAFASPRSRVRSPYRPPKLEIAAVLTAAIFPFDHRNTTDGFLF